MSSLLITMVRPNLEDLPAVCIADGYVLKTAADFGDPVPVWIEAINNSFEDTNWTSEYIHAEFMDKQQYDPAGVYFVMHGDTPVSTAFAWIDDPDEQVMGRVHFVGTRPEHRGKGLARGTVSAVLHRLRERGLQKAMLGTHPFRLPAISVYLKLGFEPAPGDDPEQQAAWEGVMKGLGRG